MEVSGVHHIELNVMDLERSFEFYKKLSRSLRGTYLERSPNSFTFHFGGFYLFFNEVQPRFREVTYHRKRTGLDHLAFRLGSQWEVRKLEELLTEAGIPMLNHAGFYGPRYFALYFEDPDRIKLEFGADTEEAANEERAAESTQMQQ